MAFDPWAATNQGLANFSNALDSMEQAKRQRALDEQNTGLRNMQMEQSKATLADLQAKQGAVQQRFGGGSLQDAYAKQMEQEGAKKDFDSFLTNISALKKSGASPAAITAFAKTQLAQSPQYKEMAQHISFIDDTDLEITKSFKDGELPDPTRPGQFLPAGDYTVKGKMTGDPAKPIAFNGITPYKPKADPEALLDKRLAAQAEITDKQIAAQDRRTAAQIAASDRRAERSANPPKKPMPPAALKMANDAKDAIATASNIQSDLGVFKDQLSDGQLDLGLLKNYWNRGLNAAGLSTQQSRNLETFRANLEKLRNDSLRLNKGVQTDGDAQRAWNELIANINDKKVVSQRLDEIIRLNERALTLQQLNLDTIYENYNRPTPDTTAIKKPPAAVGKAPTKAGKKPLSAY